jgi:cysteine protease ATG4
LRCPKDENELQQDLVTRIWFTYRKGFAQINGNGPETDQGWGCMIRCGQMLLAEVNFFGKFLKVKF